VTYSHLDPAAALTNTDAGGIELLVIDGIVTDAGDTLPKGSWLRLPDGQPLRAVAGPDGAKVWIKTGHLRYAAAPSPE